MSDDQVQRRLRLSSFLLAGTMFAYLALFVVLLVITGDFLRSLVIVILAAIGVLAVVMIVFVFIGGIDAIRDMHMTMRTARGGAPATDDKRRGSRRVVGSRAYLLVAVLIVLGISLLLPVSPVLAATTGVILVVVILVPRVIHDVRTGRERGSELRDKSDD